MQQLTNVPAIGTAMEGGLFGGVIKLNNDIKGVILAPKSVGQFSVPLRVSGGVIEGADSFIDSEANTKALLAAGSEAAQIVTALDIKGFKDWLIPARDVVELFYRHFKPTTRENYCSWRDGENANSVPPGGLYTETNPAQTSLDLFKEGGEEAFDAAWYFSSTLLPSGRTACCQLFTSGRQHVSFTLRLELQVRAVSEIPL